MNQDQRARYLERAALRAAQQELKRHHGTPLTRDELLHLRIQSMEPWKRILLVLVGACPAGFGVWLLLRGGWVGSGLFLVTSGAVFILIGVAGRRRTVEICLDQIGSELAQAVVETVINSLDGL